MKKEQKSLAQFVIERREKLNFSQKALAQCSGLDLEYIQSIEQGYELFLSTAVRQKLAKGLKIENKELKRYEIKVNLKLVKNDVADKIREQILLNSKNPDFEIKCPKCGEKLVTRIAKLYDLEDNLVLHPKAKCSKCPFQLT